ncbi:MAG: 50S ribosomal protein L18 [Bacteroidetes bacterium]|nr:50S ribosomal protein L18 [Bacteroidota bacterium]MDA1333455.1 50S ribosomal protein L18 [Bacteroidota bacterium]
MATTKLAQRIRVKRGIRKKINGTAARPRLSVFRSNKNIYAQLVDDLSGHTLAAASSQQDGISGANPVEVAKSVGKALAESAKAGGIETVVFDRNGYQYHGRVKALAEGAREGGLSF